MTEEDTFDALRRVPYVDACVIYCIAGIDLPSTTSEEERHAISKEDLRIAGWTIEELYEESRKQERAVKELENILCR